MHPVPQALTVHAARFGRRLAVHAIQHQRKRIRRAAELSFSPLAALGSSDAVRSGRVIDTAAPIDAAPLKSQHRVRV
jgi:hypothetical protein